MVRVEWDLITMSIELIRLSLGVLREMEEKIKIIIPTFMAIINVN